MQPMQPISFMFLSVAMGNLREGYLVVFDDKTESHGTVQPSKITALSFIKLIFWTFNQLSLLKQNLHENKTDTTTSRDFRIIKKYALLP